MRIRVGLPLLLTLVFSSGCLTEAFHDPMGHKSSLKRAQREYTRMVRWGEVEKASGFVHPELRETFLAYEEPFRQIRVTEYEMAEMSYGEDGTSASVRVTYHAYSLSTMLEHEIKEVQEWERLDGNGWVVRPQLEGLIELAQTP